MVAIKTSKRKVNKELERTRLAEPRRQTNKETFERPQNVALCQQASDLSPSRSIRLPERQTWLYNRPAKPHPSQVAPRTQPRWPVPSFLRDPFPKTDSYEGDRGNQQVRDRDSNAHYQDASPFTSVSFSSRFNATSSHRKESSLEDDDIASTGVPDSSHSINVLKDSSFSGAAAFDINDRYRTEVPLGLTRDDPPTAKERKKLKKREAKVKKNVDAKMAKMGLGLDRNTRRRVAPSKRKNSLKMKKVRPKKLQKRRNSSSRIQLPKKRCDKRHPSPRRNTSLTSSECGSEERLSVVDALSSMRSSKSFLSECQLDENVAPSWPEIDSPLNVPTLRYTSRRKAGPQAACMKIRQRSLRRASTSDFRLSGEKLTSGLLLDDVGSGYGDAETRATPKLSGYGCGLTRQRRKSLCVGRSSRVDCPSERPCDWSRSSSFGLFQRNRASSVPNNCFPRCSTGEAMWADNGEDAPRGKGLISAFRQKLKIRQQDSKTI